MCRTTRARAPGQILSPLRGLLKNALRRVNRSGVPASPRLRTGRQEAHPDYAAVVYQANAGYRQPGWEGEHGTARPLLGLFVGRLGKERTERLKLVCGDTSVGEED